MVAPSSDPHQPSAHLSTSSQTSTKMLKRSPPPSHTPTKQSTTNNNAKSQPDFLSHLELFLSRRDGLDKLLKLTRYASKIILSSYLLHPNNPLTRNLTSFEFSLDLSRKAFRLGKFIQDINSFRASKFYSRQELLLSVIAYGGEGLYYFIEQFVWLGKCVLLSELHVKRLQKLSAWFEFFGYIGSVSLKVMELKEIRIDEKCLVSSIELGELREIECKEEWERLRKVREEKFMKINSILQDLGDGLVALATFRGDGGRLLWPLAASITGLLSALISTHRNWVSTRNPFINSAVL